jgi:hypothetical protein
MKSQLIGSSTETYNSFDVPSIRYQSELPEGAEEKKKKMK